MTIFNWLSIRISLHSFGENAPTLLYDCQVACALFFMARDGTLKKVFKEWTLTGALTASGLPAAIYALQNSLLQISYKNLDSLTFSMLNQTKIFFTALFTFLILRYVPIWLNHGLFWTSVFTVICRSHKINFPFILLLAYWHSD